MAVIFDMDGVLVDSETHWREVSSGFLKELVPGWSEREQQRIHGMSVKDVHQLIVTEYGLNISVESYLAHYQALAKAIYLEKAELLAGASELLAELAAAEVQTALCSSSPREWVELVLSRLRPHKFVAVTSGSELEGASKPSPEIYQRCLEKLSIPAEAGIAIEDTKKGVASARSAGLFVVGVTTPFSGAAELSAADLLIESLEELSLARLREAVPAACKPRASY